MQPFGNGGSSFPSGHTAAACSVFILTLACDVCLKWNRRRTPVSYTHLKSLHLLRGSGEFQGFTDQLALVVFSQVGDVGFKQGRHISGGPGP